MEFKRVQLTREAGACSFGGMIQEDLSQEVTVRPRLRMRISYVKGTGKGISAWRWSVRALSRERAKHNCGVGLKINY